MSLKKRKEEDLAKATIIASTYGLPDIHSDSQKTKANINSHVT